MRTIRTKLYKFEELSEEAQQTAIEQIRNRYYEYNDFAEWAIDDCALFEPLQTELDLIGFKESDFIIENNRKDIYFDTDRNSFLDCAKAMEVKHCDYFYKWLGITDEFLLQKISFNIYTPQGRNNDTTIEFICDDDYDKLTGEEQKILLEAEKKFDRHIQGILKRIEADIDYRFTDEAIIEGIQATECEFLSNGKLY